MLTLDCWGSEVCEDVPEAQEWLLPLPAPAGPLDDLWEEVWGGADPDPGSASGIPRQPQSDADQEQAGGGPPWTGVRPQHMSPHVGALEGVVWNGHRGVSIYWCMD